MARFLKSIPEAARDHAEHAGQLDLHQHDSVAHVDDTGDGLAHRRDAEDEPVAFPSFTAGASTWQQPDDLRETSLDAAARFSAAQLMRDADVDRSRHAAEFAAKRWAAPMAAFGGLRPIAAVSGRSVSRQCVLVAATTRRRTLSRHRRHSSGLAVHTASRTSDLAAGSMRPVRRFAVHASTMAPEWPVIRLRFFQS
jgi:hypothetical protein